MVQETRTVSGCSRQMIGGKIHVPHHPTLATWSGFRRSVFRGLRAPRDRGPSRRREPSGGTFTVTEGFADLGRGTPVDPNTPWIIGSATKTFVAVVVPKLAREGKLDLDAPIEDYSPDLPNASRITTRQLLQHTGGLNEYLHTDPVDRDPRREWSAGGLIAVARGVADRGRVRPRRGEVRGSHRPMASFPRRRGRWDVLDDGGPPGLHAGSLRRRPARCR
ncbi:MAG: class A beta-lactamase-related serine hydrolase [Candidatus Latescibacterota bacterium]|nr:MAG: class A beta-lactamase-related serine hydrolase [Candidatus Latescibacterota bacterium]